MCKKALLSLFILLSSILVAQDMERVGPRDLPNESKPLPPDEVHSEMEDTTEIIPELKGIELKGNVESSSYSAHGVELEGLDITAKQERLLTEKLARKYIGKPLSQDTITKIKVDILKSYAKLGRPYVLVSVPEQDVTEGTLLFTVTESHVGKVTVKGNKAFATSRYENALRLDEGDQLLSNTLVADLQWINRNPFRTATAATSPGDKPGTTDIDIMVQDQTPFRIYFGTDNTGFQETDYERLFAGFNWGNFLGLDQILSYQYSASPDFKKFQAHSGHYTIPLPWRHQAVFFGGYSTVDAKRDNNTGRTKGESGQVSGRYEIPLEPVLGSFQVFRFGIDYKRTNNNLDFGGTQESNTKVNIFQFVLGYNIEKSFKNTACFFDVELVGSPGELLDDMERSRFEALRPHASAQYLYTKAAYEQTYFFKSGETIKLKTKGQIAVNQLLPSEQMGLGGYYSVRGYRDRVVNADNGLLVSLEGTTRSMHILKKKNDNLRFLAFIDYGLGGSQLFLPNQQVPTSSLLGVGPGVRYNVGNMIVVKVDWGIAVLKSPRYNRRNNFNFSAMIAF